MSKTFPTPEPVQLDGLTLYTLPGEPTPFKSYGLAFRAARAQHKTNQENAAKRAQWENYGQIVPDYPYNDNDALAAILAPSSNFYE